MSGSTAGSAPSVTVVVCTRDRPAMLRRLLESLRVHAPAVDVLVVDSCSSTPDTADVVAAAGLPYLRLERPGLSVARNAGLRAVDSEVVAFTDDDCLVRDDWVTPLVARFADPRVGVVTGEMIAEDADPSGASRLLAGAARRTVDGLDLGHGANMAFRRSAVLEVGGFDEQLGAGTELAGAEDIDMFCRLLHAGWRGVREPRSSLLHAHTRRGPDHIRLIRGYALGSGAALAKMLRIDRGVGMQMILVTLRRLSWRLALLPVRPEHRDATMASTVGLATGFVRGLRMPVRNGTFDGSCVPATRPETTLVVPLRPVEERFIRTPPGQPQQITTSVYVLDGRSLRDAHGRLDVDGVIRHFVWWARNDPYISTRLVNAALGLTPPAWVSAAVPLEGNVAIWPDQGPISGLDALAAALQAVPLDLRTAPWHATVLDDPAGPVGVIIRAHHSWTDGLLGVKLLGPLTATEPGPLHLPPDEPPPAGPSSPVGLPVEVLRRWWARQATTATAVRAWRARPFVGRVRRVTGRQRWALLSALARVRPLARPGATFAFARLELPLPAISRRAKAAGGNVNDLLVVATAHAVAAATSSAEPAGGMARVSVPMAAGPRGEIAANRIRVVTVEVDLTRPIADAVPAVRAQVHDPAGHAAAEPSRAHATTLPGPRHRMFFGPAPVSGWALLPSLAAHEEFGVLALLRRDTVVVAMATRSPSALDEFAETLGRVLAGEVATAGADRGLGHAVAAVGAGGSR